MPKDLSKVRAILFDFDNTLVNFMEMKKRAIESAIDKMIRAGLSLSKEKALKKVRNLYKKRGIEYQKVFDELLEESMGKVEPKILAAGVVAYRKTKDKYLKPYPNVVKTLEILRKKFTLAIISDAPIFQVWTRLYDTNLHNYFNFVIAYETTRTKKPGELPFRLAMKKLGLKPHELLMVGDDPRRDIAGARRLGIPTVLAEYGCIFDVDPTKPEQKPDFKIKDIIELLDLLGINSEK